MDFIRRNIQKQNRNGTIYLGQQSITTTTSNESIANVTGFLPATNNGDGTYLVDLTNVTFNGNIVANGEVSAYGAGTSTGGGGSITIVDALTSTSTDAALSANQGRVLKNLIDNLSLDGYYSKTDIDTLLNGKANSSHSHTNYVDLSSEQTISAKKVFSNGITINQGGSINDENGWGVVGINPTGWTGLPSDGSAIGFGTGAAPVYIRTNGSLLHYDKSDSATYTILDSNNYNTYAAAKSHTHNYLPLTGGTITSSSDYPFAINNSGGTRMSYIPFQISGVNKGYIGGASNGGMFLQAGTSNGDYGILQVNTDASVSISQSGTRYDVWTDLNAANKTVGNASKLGGYTLRGNGFGADRIETKLTYLIDASSLSTSTFYPVTFASSQKTLHCEIYSVGGSADYAYNANKLSFSFSGQGWADVPKGLTVHFYNCYEGNEKTIGCIGMGNEGGVVCVWVRGGQQYYVSSNRTPTLRTSSYTNGNEIFVTGTSLNGGTNTKVTTYWTPQSTSGLGTLYHSAGLALGGSMSVSGSASLKSTLSVTGTSTFTGNTTFSNSIDVAGNTNIKNITFKPTNKATLSSAGWYRFATSTQANNGGGTYIFSIRRNYYNTNNEAYIIAATFDYNGCNFTQLAGHYNTQLITQIRCTYTSNGTAYFDLNYQGTVANEVFINAIGDVTLQVPTATTSTLTTTNLFSLIDGYKSGVKTAYGITLFRNASSGGCYIKFGSNNQLTKSWAIGSDTDINFAAYYADTSAGTDTKKFWVGSDASINLEAGTGGRRLQITNNGIMRCYQTTGTNGWTMGTYYYTNSGTVTGSFAAYGSGDTLSHYFLGKAYNDYMYKFNNNTSNPYLQFAEGGTKWYVQAYTGYMYLGAGSAKSLKIDGSGNCLAVGEVTAHSDKRLKDNIKPLTVRGELNPVTYTKNGKESIGFIADEVKEVYPELVITDESTDEKYLSLNYAQLTAVLYAEIKELKERITQLENK